MDIDKLLSDSILAIQDEIEAVRKKPQREVLFTASKEFQNEVEAPTYVFRTQNQSFQHISDLIAVSVFPNIKGEVLKFDDEKVTIRFEKPLKEPVIDVEVEWVNDFILTRMLDHLEFIRSEDSEKRKLRITEILQTRKSENWNNVVIREDGFRNAPQKEAIQKALSNRVTYIWGPPGTGKTATLGFVIANLLNQGKRVLFVSNTNRAVDVGLLSVLSAMQFVAADYNFSEICRFGDAALKDDRLQALLFNEQIDKKREEIKQQFIPGKEDIRRQFLLDTINKMISAGKEVPSKLEYELELIGSDDENSSPETDLDEQLEMLALKEIRSRQLIATTLARVCTSDLLLGLSFDAVVVDEASMASVPYLLVMAGKSKSHFIVAGDPMQLPPIATTINKKFSDFLEKDIYTLISNAQEMDDLFVWKDDHPDITCFFDTQYRLNEDLASVISDVFYDGRLKTGKTARISSYNDDLSVFIVDSSRHGAFLKVNQSDRGFKPENEVHTELVTELVRRLILRERHHPSQIGIIVPFRNVVWLYKKALREAGFYEVEAGTIHTFQGREKEAIIFDSVMSGVGQGGFKRHFSVRPFDETKNGLSVPRLLNVAFSRAKEKLVIVADMEHINKVYNGMFLSELLNRILRLERDKKQTGTQ